MVNTVLFHNILKYAYRACLDFYKFDSYHGGVNTNEMYLKSTFLGCVIF